MIESFILTRFLTDFLWEFKLLSAFQVLLFFVAYHSINLAENSKRIVFAKFDGLVFLCFLCALQSFLFQANEDTVVTGIKFSLFFLIYSAGRVADLKFNFSRGLAYICAFFLGALVIFGNSGYGYQVWGNALTYTSGYYFKTDLALSACLLLMMVFHGLTNRLLLVLCWFSTMWLVLLTNSRIFIPVVVVLPVINYLFRTSLLELRALIKNGWKTIFIVFGLTAIVLYFFGMAASDEGYLTISIDDFMSAENTQGRSIIWDALINGFFNSDIWTQIFGGGLDADRLLVSEYADTSGVEDSNSHNIYLYIIVSMGILGLMLGAMIFLEVINIFRRIKKNEDSIIKLKILVASSLAMLLISGLTTDSLVRPQMMTIVCFFVGLLVQESTQIR